MQSIPIDSYSDSCIGESGARFAAPLNMKLPEIHLPDWVTYTGAALFGAGLLAWAGWLTHSVWQMGTNHMPTVGQSLSRIETQLTEVVGRIDRISNRLPTEIARNSQDTIEREIRTAIVVGRPYDDHGAWMRDVFIVDGPNGSLKKVQMRVTDAADQQPIDKMFGTFRKEAPGAELSFSTVASDAKKYGIDLSPMPSFVDTTNSVLLNMDFRDANKIFYDAVDAQGVPKTVVISPPGRLTYKELVGTLTKNQGNF